MIDMSSYTRAVCIITIHQMQKQLLGNFHLGDIGMCIIVNRYYLKVSSVVV